MIKQGDIVEIYSHSHWGGLIKTSKIGVVVKRTYLAYDNRSTCWDVLVGESVVNMKEDNLRKLYRECEQ